MEISMESSNSFDHIGSFLILFGVGIAELILFTLFAYGIAFILFKKMKDQHPIFLLKDCIFAE